MRRESGEPFQAAIEARPNDFIPSPDFAEPDGKSGLMVVISDFSAQHEAQHLIKQQYRDLQKVNQRAERLNAILRAIRNVNQLITHEEDRERLIKGACECLTEDLSYPTAWVTLISETGPNLVAASQDYFEIGFASLKNQLGRGEYPSCMRQALKTDQVLMVNNPRMECPECPASSQYEGRTGLIRRLSYGGKTFGVLTVAAPSEFADDAEEQSLFDEVAGDLAFALHKIEMSEQLSESRRRYREIFEGSRDGFVVLDPRRAGDRRQPGFLRHAGLHPGGAEKAAGSARRHPGNLAALGSGGNPDQTVFGPRIFWPIRIGVYPQGRLGFSGGTAILRTPKLRGRNRILLGHRAGHHQTQAGGMVLARGQPHYKPKSGGGLFMEKVERAG